MDFFIPILLGLVQGITEFLPISSSGHLLLFEKILGVQVDYLLLNVILHFATLLAVVWYYRKTLFYMITHPLCRLNKYLIIATIPAVAFVLIFGGLINNYFTDINMLGIGFILTAIFLSVGLYFSQKNLAPKPLKYSNVIIMGFSQGLALFPGLSRSGTTLAFGLIAGAEKQTALDFSFLMSIPIILASLMYELFSNDLSNSFIDFNITSVILSSVVAFASALLGLYLMKKLLQKLKLWYFIPYLAIIGLLVLILL